MFKTPIWISVVATALFMLSASCSSASDTEDSSGNDALELTIAEPVDGATVGTKTVTIRGRAPANAEVKRDKSFGRDDSIKADSNGEWQYEIELDEGENEFEFFLQADDNVRIKYSVTYDPNFVADASPGTTVGATSAPTSVATAGPTAESKPQTPTAIPPTSAPPFINGLTAVDVTGNLEDQGFSCTGPEQLQTLTEWKCEKNAVDGSYQYLVSVLGEAATRIRSVDSTAFNFTGSGDLSGASAFLSYVATIPYDDADPASAQAWVQQNIAGDPNRTFGSANYSLSGPPSAKTLLIIAVGAQ